MLTNLFRGLESLHGVPWDDWLLGGMIIYHGGNPARIFDLLFIVVADSHAQVGLSQDTERNVAFSHQCLHC